jgi:hypothetical protein
MKMKHRELNPRTGTGIFFILLGLALLVATNDLLNLGSFTKYFTWETALIFIGILLLANLHFTGGILMIAGGTWFLLDNIYFDMPYWVKTLYWPGVVILIGLGFIISSLVGKQKKDKQLTGNQ